MIFYATNQEPLYLGEDIRKGVVHFAYLGATVSTT